MADLIRHESLYIFRVLGVCVVNWMVDLKSKHLEFFFKKSSIQFSIKLTKARINEHFYGFIVRSYFTLSPTAIWQAHKYFKLHVYYQIILSQRHESKDILRLAKRCIAIYRKPIGFIRIKTIQTDFLAHFSEHHQPTNHLLTLINFPTTQKGNTDNVSGNNLRTNVVFPTSYLRYCYLIRMNGNGEKSSWKLLIQNQKVKA